MCICFFICLYMSPCLCDSLSACKWNVCLPLSVCVSELWFVIDFATQTLQISITEPQSKGPQLVLLVLLA